MIFDKRMVRKQLLDIPDAVYSICIRILHGTGWDRE